MKHVFWIISFAFISSSSYAQIESNFKNPIEGRLLLMQKGYGAPEVTVSKQDLRFVGSNSHSIGIGAGIDFWLHSSKMNSTTWVIQSTLYWHTVPIVYAATLPADAHGLDQDVSWTFHQYSSGLDASLGLVRKTKINETLNFRLGLSFGIQHYLIRPSAFNVNLNLRRDGIPTNEQIVGAPFFFPGFGGSPNISERTPQNLRFTPIFNIGVEKELNSGRHIIFDLRICHTELNNEEKYEFTLGDPGLFISKKSFIGFDIGYKFWMNKGLSRSGVE